MTSKTLYETEISNSFRCDVYYEDTDFTGYVYHANYLKFMERAREHLFGIQNIREGFENGHHFVVAKIDIEYKKPAKHADHLIVKSTAQLTRSPLFYVKQEIFREGKDGTFELLTAAQVKVVSVGDQGQPKRIPEEFLKIISDDKTRQ